MQFELSILTAAEYEFVDAALASWEGVACHSPFPVRALGFSDRDQFWSEIERLRQLASVGAVVTDLEAARVLFLSELAFGSDLFGAGIEFRYVSPFSDEEALAALRALQRKLYTHSGAKALFRPELYPDPE
ncbi:hypothetical protein [Nocardia aurea]|uniref:GNAT family N-acetyltransferase n=1 Tax=Nocardia aurea TaxID=2144174 RepID=A0ABV3FW22_9NOCA